MDLKDKSPGSILKSYWGYSEFRHLQEEIIDSVLSGKDTLALLPTGGGKSLCYQVPALCLEGICLVISPLIALMQDQVSRLKSLQIDAACVHSGMHYREIDNVLSTALYGSLKILYISPERLASSSFMNVLSEIKISFVAIDEAHCISQWGHDFRPAYLKISELREWCDKPFLALTATATPYVKQEIVQHLKLNSPELFEMSFRREQLSIVVKEEEQKNDTLLHLLKNQKESVIIYTRNRRQTVEIAKLLQKNQHAASYYHAGLSSAERATVQEDWIQNKTRIIVSTNAFGMGIDKPDVRMVIHLDLPQGIEEYYQEAGRAGRDQKRAYAVLLYHQQDINNTITQWEELFPEPEEIKNCYKYLSIYFDIATGSVMEESKDFDILEFISKFKLPLQKTLNALKILQQSNFIVMTDSVLVSSKIQILGTKGEINEYRQRDEKIDNLIQALLRTYEGIFSVPVQIQESLLARICKMELNQIILVLKFLHNEQLIQYQESRNKPQLLILNQRLKSDQIEIDEVWYKKRKAILKERLQNLLSFIKTTTCRQRFITDYFGQKLPTDCGICDNCLEKKSDHPDNKTMEVWTKNILEFIKQHQSVYYRDVLKRFPMNKKSWVEEILKNLIAENQIIRRQEKLWHKDSN